MGKGDTPRPVDKAKYDKNYDRIFRSKKDAKVPNGITTRSFYVDIDSLRSADKKTREFFVKLMDKAYEDLAVDNSS